MTRIIAFYLPQYHPTPDNDKWWGKGFTEWTNVGKAKPLFRGHYQPRVPADLGYYDLRLPEVREAQVELAKEAGIAGFCYYHYWFGDGKQELEMPFNEIVSSKKPNFPFCLCWANESWHAKFWNKDGKCSSKRMLIEQQYLGYEDDMKHFYNVLPAFKDRRYITVDGKPLFCIYQPLQLKNASAFIKQWTSLAKANGLKGIYFVAQTPTFAQYDELMNLGFDAITLNRLFEYPTHLHMIKRFACKIKRCIFHTPIVYSYKEASKTFIGKEEELDNVFPTIIPNWDHTPRSGLGGYVLRGSSPDLFKKHVITALEKVKGKKDEHQIIFLKSWNEWGEGNYVEPDLKFGHGYIDALSKALQIEEK